MSWFETTLQNFQDWATSCLLCTHPWCHQQVDLHNEHELHLGLPFWWPLWNTFSMTNSYQSWWAKMQSLMNSTGLLPYIVIMEAWIIINPTCIADQQFDASVDVTLLIELILEQKFQYSEDVESEQIQWKSILKWHRRKQSKEEKFNISLLDNLRRSVELAAKTIKPYTVCMSLFLYIHDQYIVMLLSFHMFTQLIKCKCHVFWNSHNHEMIWEVKWDGNSTKQFALNQSQYSMCISICTIMFEWFKLGLQFSRISSHLQQSAKF